MENMYKGQTGDCLVTSDKNNARLNNPWRCYCGIIRRKITFGGEVWSFLKYLLN